MSYGDNDHYQGERYYPPPPPIPSAPAPRMPSPDQETCGYCGHVSFDATEYDCPDCGRPLPRPPPASKWCSQCREEKWLSDFARDGRLTRSECKACQAEARKRAINAVTREQRRLRNIRLRARVRVLLARARRGDS